MLRGLFWRGHLSLLKVTCSGEVAFARNVWVPSIDRQETLAFVDIVVSDVLKGPAVAASKWAQRIRQRKMQAVLAFYFGINFLLCASSLNCH